MACLLPWPAVQVGDRVVYSKYAGTELEVNGAEHLLLKVSVFTLMCAV